MSVINGGHCNWNLSDLKLIFKVVLPTLNHNLLLPCVDLISWTKTTDFIYEISCLIYVNLKYKVGNLDLFSRSLYIELITIIHLLRARRN